MKNNAATADEFDVSHIDENSLLNCLQALISHFGESAVAALITEILERHDELGDSPASDSDDTVTRLNLVKAINAASARGAPPYCPATRWNDYFPWPPPGGLRHIIFHADTNGFAPAIKRVGRSVILNTHKFWEIVEEQNGSAKA